MSRRAASTSPRNRAVDAIKCIPSGSTVLNCACSDHYLGGYAQGTLVNIIGDSSAGKTVLGLTGMAEAAYMPEYDGYQLIIDDVEAALLIDMRRMFGRRAAERIEHWNLINGKRSNDIYDFYGNVARLLDKGKPFIYLLDSMDAITTPEEADRCEQMLKDPAKVKGSYGMQKPKMLSEILRNICSGLYETKSTLIIISQTRDKVDAIGYGTKKTRAGGKALKFYATTEMWMTVIKTHKEEKYKRVLGAEVNVKVSKNKITGKVREAEFSIFYDYGVDDIGSCVDFMIDYNGWKKASKGYFVSPYFPDQAMTRNLLVKAIEEKKLSKQLRKDAGALWLEIEDAVRLKRAPRFEDD